MIAGRSFNGAVVGAPPDGLDAGGGVPADGSVTLQGCGAPDVDYSGATVPSLAIVPAQCGGAPTLPSYVTLPTCACTLVQPSITATKTCISATADGVTFTVNFNGTVCNDGNVDVTLTQLTDDQPVAGTNIFPSLSTTALAVNACATYSGSFLSASNPSTDTINAEGEGANGSGHVSASATAICDPVVGCGNFVVEPGIGETCDDGNTNPNDACNACRKNICGDGVQNPAAEQCDDGNLSDNDACKKNCKPNVCGDKLVNPAAEQCDDGNKSNNDACKNNCTLSACGDGVRNPTTEKCDDGNQSNNDGCKTDCTRNICGDGLVNFLAEQCDDGNTTNTDSCTNACQAARCGDGIVGPGEQCDDGNTTNTDSCTNACQAARCGDGIVGPGEQCDDGNQNDTDSCSNACQMPQQPVCGNGTRESGEECDDGNTTNTDSCTNACQAARCGDGIVGPGEQCDDGNTMAGDGCSATCQTETPQCNVSFLIIDEDSIDNGIYFGTNPDNKTMTDDSWGDNSGAGVNDDIAYYGVRAQLRYFESHVGQEIVVRTGQVGDEGWFALESFPSSWHTADNGAPDLDGLANYIGDPTFAPMIPPPAHGVGIGLGAPDGSGNNAEVLLDKIEVVMPLRGDGIGQMVGKTVCALVYDSDISINYDAQVNGNLQGANLGTVAFEVISATNVAGTGTHGNVSYSDSSLPNARIRILNADEVCPCGNMNLVDAPNLPSSSSPPDVTTGPGNN